MCTVTYYPTSAGFVLTHNRDEAPTRSPQHITQEKNIYRRLLFPRDTKAGGTWIAATDAGLTLAILNGAFIKHQHQPPYRRSRGLLLLDSLATPKPEDFLRTYDYTGIEPFTLLAVSRNSVQELRWDGGQTYWQDLPAAQDHFWCSATLYPPDMQQRREAVYRNWLRACPRSPTPAALLELHRTGSVQDPENDFVMNRHERVRTVSITQVVQTTKALRMRYFDLLSTRQDVRTLTFQSKTTG